MSLVAFYIFFALWVGGFSIYFYNLAQQNNYIALFAGIIPGIMILTYGVGGILLTTLSPEERYLFYQAYFSDADLLFVLFYSILASTLFFISFLLAGRGKVTPQKKLICWSNQFNFHPRKIHAAAVILLVFDLLVRILKINSGVYINWVAARVHDVPYWKTTLFQLESFLVPFLGVFLYVLSRKKKWAKIFLFLLIGLILFEGDRSSFIAFIIPIAFAYLYFNQVKPSIFFIAKVFIFFVFFFGFIGPAIQEVRYEVRSDYKIILENPKQTFYLMFTKYIPENVRPVKLYGEESRRGESSLKRRFMGWPAFWASINSKIRSGKAFRGIDEGARTMALCIPSILYPGNKPEIKSGKDNLDWYDLYVRTNDPHSTVFLDAFATGGFYGMIGVPIVYGCLFGFLARFLINRWQATGTIIYFGFVNNLIITRDSFGTIFVNFRNSIIIIIILMMLFLLSKIRLHYPKRKFSVFGSSNV